jgi:hypothetical protein
LTRELSIIVAERTALALWLWLPCCIIILIH